MIERWQQDMRDATKDHNLSLIKQLCETSENQDFHFTDDNGRTLLHYAVAHTTANMLPTLQFLLEKDIDPQSVDKNFVSALELAKQKNNIPALTLMKYFVNLQKQENLSYL